ncbi:hypothetical protein ASG90_07940 [Nocardioides sp. Soil797]|nr:hypothetical protein ASG90_07940 [Nocardioides sp. Soil797]
MKLIVTIVLGLVATLSIGAAPARADTDPVHVTIGTSDCAKWQSCTELGTEELGSTVGLLCGDTATSIPLYLPATPGPIGSYGLTITLCGRD